MIDNFRMRMREREDLWLMSWWIRRYHTYSIDCNSTSVISTLLLYITLYINISVHREVLMCVFVLRKVKIWTIFLDFCMASFRRDHANLLDIIPNLSKSNVFKRLKRHVRPNNRQHVEMLSRLQLSRTRNQNRRD